MPERESEIVTVQLEDGQHFLLEVSRSNEIEDVADFGNISSAKIFKSISTISTLVVDAIKESAPDKFSVEFGIEVSAKAGQVLALLCNGEGKANLKVTLEWAKKV